MKIVHVAQEQHPKLCAHCCAAMVLNVSRDRACVLMGHKRTTRTRELVKVLRSHALMKELVRARSLDHVVEEIAIVRVKWGTQLAGHFALKVGGWIHDPLKKTRLSSAAWLAFIETDEGRVTSYLPVRLKPR